ncbi:TPA: phage tail tape measure protein [Salmonella enterica subsp. enterica serovar Potsdam]
MDQIANLVIDLSIDSAEFRNEVPRIKKLLNDAAGDSERSAARMQRFLDKQTEATRRTSAGLEQVTASSTAYSSAVEKSAAASTRLAADVDQTRQRVEALGRKLREEQAQSAAVAAAQDRTSAAFYRQIDSVKQLSGGLQELQRIQAQVRQAKGRGDISQGDYLALVSETARKTRELTDAEALATQKKAQFIRRLKEQTTVQGLSRTELLRVKAAELGVSSAADIYIRKLERTGTATHTLGLKSAAARRELGVLAGELARGNFGALRGSGITLANRAGWIEQLMSPKGMMLGGLVGGVAAAVYGLGKAYYEGAKESEAFNKQLILTGSYAGKTTGQLNAMAKSLAGNGVTQHDAAGVLAQVVGSGAFTGQAVAMVSRTATRMQENVGQSVDETIRQFKRLRDDPVNAAKELDRTLHFLTATQLEQIRVLGEQGRVADAAKIAMSAYSEEMNKRMGDVHDNLGWIERAWNAVGDAAKWAWDRMLDIGREDTLDEKIATLQEKIARGRKTPWTVSSSWTEYDQQQLNELQEQKRQKDLLDAKAQAERNYQETQKRRNEQNAALNRDNETESLRHQREVARITAMQYADAAVRNAALERENERHKKALSQQAKKPKTYHNDEARRLLLQYSQQQAQTEGQLAAAKLSTTEKMTEAHKQLLSFQQRISDLSGKKLTADEKSVLAHKDELVQALTLLDVKQQELRRQSALNDLKKKAVQLASQLNLEEQSQRQQHDLELATAGMGDVQKQRYQEQLTLRQKFAQQMEQLERDSRQKGTYGSTEYSEAEQKLRDSLNVQLNENRRYWQQLSVEQRNWKNGAARAFQNYTADAGSAAGAAEQMFSSAFSSMGNGLATFVTTGKLNFKSFTASLLSDLAKIMAQMAMMQAVKGVGNALGFGVTANADGGVYQSASLGRYSGSVVDRPTYFAFAKGAGVMGEAGPEAILPLRRGADGKLGVVAAGAGGMAMFAPQYHIEIINQDGSNGQIGPGALKAVYDVGRKAAADFFAQQSRDGGRLS